MLFSDKEIPEITRQSVNSAVRLGRIPCSILLTGAGEKLREKCAYELAACVLCQNVPECGGEPCGECSACRRAKTGLHPDIIRVLPDEGKKLLSVKNVRESCLSRLYASPAEGANKVFLFPDCDNLQPVVQNALLKSVEEPPEDTMFIFCASSREVLLPTVISRLTEYYLGDTVTKSEKKEDLNAFDIAKNIVLAMSQEDEFAVMAACAPMHKNRRLMATVAEKIILIIRDAMVQGTSADNMSESGIAAYSMARSFSVSSLLQIKEIMDKIEAEASLNANENLLITRFSSDVAEIMKHRI